MNDKILLIDDQPVAIDILKVILEVEDYHVITAYDGETGLEMAFGEEPDLIILDVMMPGIDGFDVCRQIREGGLQMPILMASRKADISDRVKGLEAGADDYLVQPGDLRELLARVRALLRRSTPIKPYLRLDNPYIVGAPVPPDKFYGRRQMIGAILAAIKAKNHVAIYGERRIGKTSLLHQLEHLLKLEHLSRKKVDAIFFPLFIQMQMLSEDDFFGALIDEALKSTPISVKETLPPLVRRTSSQPYKGLHLLQDLEMIIPAWNKKAAKPVQLVFLLDEGERLNEFSEETQMRLRGLLQKPLINQHVRLVWSGVGIDRTWYSDTSPWFNLFKDEFHVDSLRPEDARRLILEPVAGVYDYEQEAVAKIQELSLNKPYLIQRLCSNCIYHVQERGMNRGRITLQDVEAVWADIQKRDESNKLFTY